MFEQAFLYRETALGKIKPTNSDTVPVFSMFVSCWMEVFLEGHRLSSPGVIEGKGFGAA